MLSRVALGEPASCSAPSSQKSALIYVDDVAAILAGLCTAETLRHSIYLSGGDTCSLAELAGVVRDILPDAAISFDETAPEFAHVYRADDLRVRTDLKYLRPSLKDRVIDHLNAARAGAMLEPL
jgi:nucleoside-diphosphate-sugar epimerase